MEWENANHGTARITSTDLAHRRFILDDGNHRAHAMREMTREKHKHAIAICQRGCVLLDCNPDTDRDLMVFSSLAANNKLLAIDKDFLADKLGQIKKVRVFCFCLHCPWNHYSHPNTNMHCRCTPFT